MSRNILDMLLTELHVDCGYKPTAKKSIDTLYKDSGIIYSCTPLNVLRIITSFILRELADVIRSIFSS